MQISNGSSSTTTIVLANTALKDLSMKKLLSVILLVAGTLSCVQAESLVLTSANISGSAGSTVGWGFTLVSTTHYLTIVNVALLPTPSIGVFADTLGIRPTFEVGPAPAASTSVTELFNAGLGTGIASFTIGNSAPVGAVAYGTLFAVYNLYTVSPNNDPLFDPFNPAHTFAEGLSFEIPVSITVVTPEPASYLQVSTALLAAAWFARHRRAGMAPRSLPSSARTGEGRSRRQPRQ